MTGWLIRMHGNCAYIWKRKFFCGVFAIPWKYHGGTRIILTQDSHGDVLQTAIEYIVSREEHADITVKF